MKRALFLMLLWLSSALQASQLPPGFVEQLLAQNLDPTDMVMTPDGRIFITIKSGKIVIVENGVLSATPLLNIPVYNYNEAGLCHMVLDPNFEVNHYYYVYYTVQEATHNRVSRFTANGNSTVPGSEVVILDVDAGTLHNGGDMAFGIDGKLYIAVGEGDDTSKAQSFGSLLGKVLRINADGTIPSDNPFFNDATVVGRNKAIFALGFRNPFSMDIQPGTGKIFLSDAGAEIAEEIDEVKAGKNYGWPLIEGMRTNEVAPANYQDPFYAYLHGFTAFTGCAVVAAAFYNPTVNQFPSQYVGKFFYADYCQDYINYIDPITGIASTFATQILRPVGVLVAPDGTLYYLARAGLSGSADANTSTNEGTLWKVTYTGSGVPIIAAQPQDKLAVEGDNVNFTIAASGSQPISYQWLVNGAPIPGATQATYTFTNVQLIDDGKNFSCTASNSLGSVTSQQATLSVISNTRPVPQLTVTLPANVTLYQAGQTFTFSGNAVDNEEGVLPPSALTWKIDFHHELHIHPALQPTTGITSGSFSISRLSHISEDDVWYRVILTATDSKGLSTSIYQDIFPQKTSIILNTTPPNLILTLDGQPTQTPDTVISVVGMTRVLEAPATVMLSGNPYLFSNWTPSGLGRSFTFNAPAADVAYSATYTAISIQPQNPVAVEGDDVNFSITASGAQPFSYQWRVNGTPITGATFASYTFSDIRLTDNGKEISCTVSNSFGSVNAQESTLSVIQNTQPIPQLTVTLPANATLYQAGQTFTFSGSAVDNEEGVLPPAALTWKIDFHHALHFHPALQSTSGISSGSFSIPRLGETSDDVWYRIILTAIDSKGLSNSMYQDVFPQKVRIILNSTPPNLILNLDGQPTQTPDTVTSVVGITRTLEAPETESLSGKFYSFLNWTQPDLNRLFTFNAPSTETSYTANYTSINQGDGLLGLYYNTLDKINTELHSFEGRISLRRIDPRIDFDWSDGSPHSTFIDNDFFTVRWIGEVLPLFSETYTFYLTSDDGVRLWVNDVSLIDQWIPHDSTEWSGSIPLIAGKKYPIKIEYFEEAGCAVARLKWKSQQVPKQTVPQINLFASTVTEIMEMSSHKMASIFPCPADMEITFQLFAPTQKDNGYLVSDLVGRKLLQGNLAANQKEWRVDISTLPPGYFIFKTSQHVLPFIKK